MSDTLPARTSLIIESASLTRPAIVPKSPLATRSFEMSLDPMPTHVVPASNQAASDSRVGDTPPVAIILIQGQGALIAFTKAGPRHRDQCVFDERIDIEDSMQLVVDYANGAKMSYSLNSFAPWEGYVVTFNGSRGRLEHKCEETAYVNGDGAVPGALQHEGTWIRVYPHREPAYQVKIGVADGGHGGANPVMLGHIFDPDNRPEDPLMRAADHRSGAWSIMTGIAANHSMKSGQAVRIDDLVAGIGMPDYPGPATAVAGQ